MNKLILVLLALLLAATYAVRMQKYKFPSDPNAYKSAFVYQTDANFFRLQAKENEESLDVLCELCFGGDEISRVQLKEDEGFDCEEIVDDCFGDDGSSE